MKKMAAETSNARGEWVLVPRNPTEAMIDAWRDAPDIWEDAYTAMLAAAPQPPSAPVGVEAIAAEIRASLGRGATVCTRRRWAIELEALAQQPAAGDGDFINRIADSLIAKGWDIDPNCDGTGVAQLRGAVISALATQRQEPKP